MPAITVYRWTAAMILGAAALLALGIGAGCAGRPSLLPNPDPALRKKPAEFAVDAAKRFPYKAQAPRGGELSARAEMSYGLNRLDLANLSGEDWEDVEIWVNQSYVLHIPKVRHGKVERITFTMLYDDGAKHFPVDNTQAKVEKVEVLKDGKLFEVPARPAY